MRIWLNQRNNRSVWSISALGDGLNSTSRKHGDFDNDVATLASLAHVIEHGF